MFWYVINDSGQCFIAPGNDEAEAIENARPMFASHVIYDAAYGTAVPDPRFLPNGLRAELLGDHWEP